MGGDRELANCCYLNLLIVLLTMVIKLSSSQVIKEINRDYHGDIFIISGDPISCDPSLCSEGQRFAAPVNGHPCKCQCDPSKQIFREDIQQCVRDLDDCPLITFTRTYISETIPVVSLPTAGQLVHPGAHLNLENRHNLLNQTCRVESDLVMTNDGWLSINGKPVFALIADGSRSFLQWVGNDQNRRQLEQKLVLIRFNCQLKPRHGSIEVAPYRPCAAVRIGWVPGSSLGLLKVQGNVHHPDGNTGSTTQGKGTSGYLIIGLSIGVLGLTYVLSLMIYLRSKRVDNLKDHRSNNSSFQQSSFHSSNHHHGSFGDSSSNQTGSSSLERGGDEDANSKTKCFTLSMDRVDYGEIAGEFNPSIKSDSINNSKRKSQQKEINKSDDNCQQKTQSSDVEICLKSIDQGHLLSTITSSSLSVPISSPNPSSINNLSSSSPSLLTFPLSSSSLSSPSSSSSSSPQSPASSPSQSLTTITNIVNHHHHHHHNQHTPSSLNSLQARVKEKSAQFNGQFCGQTNTNVQIVSNLSPQPFRRSNRLSRRDLSIAPKLLDPEALSSPSPTAIEFLSRLREVISSARGRMRAFRFKPTLLVIPEDDYFISELKSKDKSISLSTTSDSSSMGSPSSLESESELQMNRNEILLSQEALSMYQQQYQQDNSYQQPLSLPVAISTVSQSNSWKSSVNQFRPKLLSFGSSRRASDNSKAKVTTKEIAFSDSELSNDRSHEPRHEHQLSSSLSSIYKKNCDSSMVITAWGDDKASKVSRREIVDRLAEEMVTVNDDQNVTISNENGNMEQTNYSNEPDSLNDLSDINENLFETKGNHNNNNSGNNNYDDTISSENLANLSNEVEKKLAQRSIVPLPEVVTEITETCKARSKIDGVKSNHSSHGNHNHSKEDSRLSQLVADLKHFTRKRKQIKTVKSLPLVSDNNWMLQPVASMSLRLPSSSSRPSLSSSSVPNKLLENRSMRNNIRDNNSKNGNKSGKYNSNNNKNAKSANKQSRSDDNSQVITIQEGRYLNFNNHSSSISDEEPNSTGNEMITSRFPLETWSLSSEPSNGSSSPNYNQNNNSINKNSVNINIDMIGEENYARQTIVDPLTLDDDEMFITFAGNEFESNGNEGEVGYISRFNLIKKYIDDPNIFSDKGKGDDEQQVNGEDYLEEERSLSSTINENSNENNNILRNQMITMSLSDSSASSSESSSSNNHYNSTSNVINSTNSMKPWKSIDSKHLQSSPQSLPLLSSLSSIRSSPSSSAHLYPLDMCSSDDCLSSASVSSIMFMESPKQGRRNSVDHRLNRQSIDITERDNQINYGNNNNNNDDVINSSMMVRGSSNRGNWNNKLNQRSNNGIRLNRQSPVEKRHFPNGLMTIA